MFCLVEYDGIYRRMKINLMEFVLLYREVVVFFGIVFLEIINEIFKVNLECSWKDK